MANGQSRLNNINKIREQSSENSICNCLENKIIIENNKDGNIYTTDSKCLPVISKETGYVFSTLDNGNTSVRNSNVKFKILIPNSKILEIEENLSCNYCTINNDPKDENSIKIIDLNIPGCVSNYDTHNIFIEISKPSDSEFKTNNYRNIKFIIKDLDSNKPTIETYINLIIGFFATETGDLPDNLDDATPINFSPYKCNVVYDISLSHRNKSIVNINKFEFLKYEAARNAPKNNIILNSSKLISSDNTIAINGVNASNAVSSFLVGCQQIKDVNNVFSFNASSKYEIDSSISSNAGYITTDNGLHIHGRALFYDDAGRAVKNNDNIEFKPYITMSDIKDINLSGVTNSEVLLSAKNFAISNFVPLSGNAHVRNNLTVDNIVVNYILTAKDIAVKQNFSADNTIIDSLSVNSNALINDSLIISGYVRNGKFDKPVRLDSKNINDNNMSKYSHAEGSNTAAAGEASHAEGNSTAAVGDASHAEGNSTSTYAGSSHAEGHRAVTMNGGDYSHAEGHETKTHGKYAHAEGEYTEAYGIASHTAGIRAKTNKDDAYAFSWNGLSSYANNDTNNMYPSHGIGTFNINPVDGLSGFYIGEESLDCIIKSVIDSVNTSTNLLQYKNECICDYPTADDDKTNEDSYPGIYIPINSNQFKKIFVIKQNVNGNEYDALAVSNNIYKRTILEQSVEYTKI